MKKMFFLALMVHGSVALADVTFVCKYDKGEKTLFEISGKLDDKGGKLSMKGSYVTGWEGVQKVKYYRSLRLNEASLEYAKFDNKSPQLKKGGFWLPVYYRFSLPKQALEGDSKKFPAYVAFYKSEEPDELVTEELPPLQCRKR